MTLCTSTFDTALPVTTHVQQLMLFANVKIGQRGQFCTRAFNLKACTNGTLQAQTKYFPPSQGGMGRTV